MNARKFPHVGALPPESHVPGVVLRQADFAGLGDGEIPFRGGLFTVEPNCTSRLDVHVVRECWMIAQGSGRLTYDGEPVRVQAGDVLYFESHRSHQVQNDGATPLVISTVWWQADAV
ncbi:cupin domain-containing protein [Burkholderia cenocepacia]|uniref:cupin domain-containing protein n=1 Tax=Burkholderia cenocepacia TaxID=95486 RepID=UPI002AB7EBD7|nr:cupin domain-containing protein [Burkholderia cenocepacia]